MKKKAKIENTENKMYKIYKIENTINHKVYIGKTKQKLSRRFRNGTAYQGKEFSEDIKTYGWDAFSKECLLDGLSEEDAGIKEKEYIAEYDSTNPDKGYNRTTGGDNGFVIKLTDDVHDKMTTQMSANLTTRWKEDAAYRAKRSESLNATVKTQGYRKRCSENKKDMWANNTEYREKQTAERKRRASTPEGKKHMSEIGQQAWEKSSDKIRKGVEQYWENTPEAHQRVSDQFTELWKDQGYRDNLSKKHSALFADDSEYRAEYCEKYGRKVALYRNGEFIALYDSIRGAAKHTGVNRCTIKYCCDKQGTTKNGDVFRYYDGENKKLKDD